MNLSFLFDSSFWGKFGENEHGVQTIAIQDENVWQKLIQDESLVIKDVRIFNEDVMEVSVMKKEKDACEGAGKTTIFIACFTTALARLKLYAELEKVGKCCIMTRTQSSTAGNNESRLYLQESFWVR